MATLDEATNVDTSNYHRVEPPSTQVKFVPENLLPTYNPMLRTPLPPSQSSPDAQRNFYLGGKIPQFRIATPVTPATTSSITQIVNSSSSTSTSSSSATSTNQDQTGAIVTDPIDVGEQFQGNVLLAKLVTIKSVSVDNPARVRLYSTQAQQIADATRGDNVTSLDGTQHGVIVDLWLDTDLTWVLSPAAVGGNCDSPDITSLYVTIDNIGFATTPITASFQFVGEET